MRAFSRRLIGNAFTLVETSERAIYELSANGPFDYIFLDHDLGGKIFFPSGPGTGFEVAQYIRDNRDKITGEVVVHSFNELGAQNMKSVLPDAYIIPAAWEFINV